MIGTPERVRMLVCMLSRVLLLVIYFKPLAYANCFLSTALRTWQLFTIVLCRCKTAGVSGSIFYLVYYRYCISVSYTHATLLKSAPTF